jgi:oxalate decarboxylase
MFIRQLTYLIALDKHRHFGRAAEKGAGRMTVFPGEEKARTMDFHPNDVGFVSSMAGHYIQNISDEDLVFLELFVAPEFQEISLNRWLRALPAQAAIAHTNLKKEDLEKIPADGNPVRR